MSKIVRFLAVFIILAGGAGAGLCATGRVPTGTVASDYVSPNSYNNMYPYLTNKMRTGLNPGTSPSQTINQIDVLTRTLPGNAATSRRVVPRGTSGAARAAVTQTGAVAPVASATNSGGANTRRVVARGTSARSATNSAMRTAAGNTSRGVSARRVVARGGRDDATTVNRVNTTTNNTIATDGNAISSVRCLADYTECMNGYCQRENTAYNRCYCSASLAQIDAKYQTDIDTLIKKILTMRTKKNWTDAEMNQYWMDAVGKYSGENSWEKLDNALNIDWAGTESRVRGQNAFATGHDYCVQHLRGCFYMAANLRDAYRSEIARDCATYETSLQKIKNAAQSIVESYK